MYNTTTTAEESSTKSASEFCITKSTCHFGIRGCLEANLPLLQTKIPLRSKIGSNSFFPEKKNKKY